VCDVQQTEALVREKESKKAHFRSLTKALVAAHNNLTLAAQSVKNWSEQGWTWNERDETNTACELATATTFLGCVMDGLVVLDLLDDRVPDDRVVQPQNATTLSFERSRFADPRLLALQKGVLRHDAHTVAEAFRALRNE
jgi:hypothetical protein